MSDVAGRLGSPSFASEAKLEDAEEALALAKAEAPAALSLEDLEVVVTLFNIAIENGRKWSFIVIFPGKDGDFPWLC